jgi:hypothetical protein
MRKVAEVLQRESFTTLAAEAVWRTRKRWKRLRFHAQVRNARCPFRFRPAGYYRPALHPGSDAGRDCLLPFAESICRGEFSLLGYAPARLGFPPPWNVDYVSARSWPQKPGRELAVIRHDGSDVKAPWELSRLQFLPVLGKAWALTGEEKYRAAAKELLADWLDKNPTGVGVNWTIAMEAALRAVSMALLLELLWPLRAEEEAWLERATRALWHHFLFIEAHSEFSHLTRSNHYLSNLFGLLALSSCLEGQEMEAARAACAQKFQQEVLHQTFPDGGSRETSLGYHVFTFQMGLMALHLMRAQRAEPQPAFVERLGGMLRLLRAAADDRGCVPHLGDCDDGRIELLSDDLRRLALPPVERDSLSVAGLLEIGAALLGEAGRRGSDAAWLGFDSADAPAATIAPPRAETTFFPHSGIACCRMAGAQLLFFATPNGLGGRGSHTHNDKLSVVVRAGGRALLCDSGTGCYSRDITLRNYFRSTRAHNAVMVDRQEQNRMSAARADLFRLGNQARVSSIEGGCADGECIFRASHSGYREFGVMCTRTVRISGGNEICIADEISGEGEHEVAVFFQVAPGWELAELTRAGKTAQCTLKGPLRVTIAWSARSELRVEQQAALQSRAYGATLGSLRIQVATTARLPMQVVSRICW